MSQRYLIALGSNQRHHRHGPPRRVLIAALEALKLRGITVERASPIITSAPLGPSARRYANAAAAVKTALEPEFLLAVLKDIEAGFGRRQCGQRWSSRVLDLDIVLWSGGTIVSAMLTVPHPAFRNRGFVLTPASAIAPDWRDPLSNLTLRQLRSRLTKRLTRPRPLPR
jgi:2-amino-4-hydroxy-6-hydroxymethyldihydropteridine diphosphokinase